MIAEEDPPEPASAAAAGKTVELQVATKKPAAAPPVAAGKTVELQVATQKPTAAPPAPPAPAGHAAGTAAQAGPPAGPETAPPYAVRTSAPVIHDYPVIPGGQRPFSSELAPSTPPMQRASQPMGPHDPAHAASVVSPVGEQYPQTDWERAAAISAKAVPAWLLVALFGGALVGAMLLTLAIAKIFV
jgi:hypothetical protein